MDEKQRIDTDKQMEARETAPVNGSVHQVQSRVALIPIGVAALVLLGLGSGYGGSWLYDQVSGGNSAGIAVVPGSKDDGNAVVTPSEESIAAVAKAVSPSVVSIITTTQRAPQLFSQAYEQQGAGTGMIISSSGYIMTNKHVIDGANKVTVVTTKGETYEDVEVLGTDPLNDVAFLKIKNASGLPAITIGDSKTIRIGQTVVAIGNALGQYQNSVTSGIISGTGRPVMASSDGTSTGAESLTDLIQTDAAINSGNSGGPLLNLKGQVIGINTAMAEGAQSIGFSIPVSATKGMIAHLIKTGKVARAYLGVQYVSINAQVKKQYELSVDKGDYVVADRGNGVQTNGPADKAGIKNGDIITKVNGAVVGEVASVSSLVSEYQPGDKVVVTILRDGNERNLTVTLGTYKS